MVMALRRQWSIYGVFFESVPKFFLAYRGWVWMSWLTESMGMFIYFYFWQAVYAQTNTLGGLGYTQLITYILLMRAIDLNTGNQVGFIGYSVRDGLIANELLRPVDLQTRLYIQALGEQFMTIVINLPLLILALLLGATLPNSPAVWLAFVVTFFMGHAIAFCVDWIIACFTFYTTEIWGLMVFIYSITLFLSGSLVPLNLMPDWLQTLCNILPFAQTRYVAIALLSGAIPIEEALARFGVQLLWLAGMLVFSRWLFSRAIRVITVQGG